MSTQRVTQFCRPENMGTCLISDLVSEDPFPTREPVSSRNVGPLVPPRQGPRPCHEVMISPYTLGVTNDVRCDVTSIGERSPCKTLVEDILRPPGKGTL